MYERAGISLHGPRKNSCVLTERNKLHLESDALGIKFGWIFRLDYDKKILLAAQMMSLDVLNAFIIWVEAVSSFFLYFSLTFRAQLMTFSLGKKMIP